MPSRQQEADRKDSRNNMSGVQWPKLQRRNSLSREGLRRTSGHKQSSTTQSCDTKASPIRQATRPFPPSMKSASWPGTLLDSHSRIAKLLIHKHKDRPTTAVAVRSQESLIASHDH